MSTAARAGLSVGRFEASRWPAWAVFAADLIALEAAFALGYAVRMLLSDWFSADIGVEQYFGVAVGTLLLPGVNYLTGLYPGYLLGPVEKLRRRTLATLAVFGGLVAWDNIVARGVLSRGVLLATFGFALLLPPLAEVVARRYLVKKGRWGVPVLMIGGGSAGRALARMLGRDADIGLVPIAFLDDEPARWNTVIEGVPVIGPVGLATDFESRAEAAIVSLADLDGRDASALLNELNFPRLVVVPDLPAIASLWTSARDLGGCLGLEVKKNLLVRRNLALKLFMDKAVALPLFAASVPLMAAAALWIKLSSRGPVFYRQMREGRAGRMIPVWKLRTMFSDSEHLLAEWFEKHPEERGHWRDHFKLRDDPRVLPGIGRLLRRTSLDELPQLWSVLRGEMSLVGPRPLPEYHLEQFAGDFRSLRTRVLPGLTGLWQVSGRSDGDLKVQQALDTFYIRNWSPWLDLYILGRTVSAVLLGRGAY